MHVTYDLTGCPQEALRTNEVYSFLRAAPDELEMTVIAGPSVTSAMGVERPSVTGYVIIAESHCSVHAFPSDGVAFVDVFSCKAFNEARLRELLQRAFEPRSVRAKQLDRGLEFLPPVAYSPTEDAAPPTEDAAPPTEDAAPPTEDAAPPTEDARKRRMRTPEEAGWGWVSRRRRASPVPRMTRRS